MTESPAARHHRLRAIRICLRAADRADDPSYARWTLRTARKLANRHSRVAVASGAGAVIVTGRAS